VGGEYSGGGSLILASLIDKAGEAIFQDLQEVYRVNLFHAIRDDVPPVEIILLIRGLGMGSRFSAALQNNPEAVGWDALTYQIATLIDAVNYTTYAVIAANSKRKPKEPKPAYRPKKERKVQNAFATQLKLAKERKARGG
jgi:hypothetical protein